MANTNILRRALNSARKFPGQHDQGCWIDVQGRSRYDDPEEELNFEVKADNGEHPPCGTSLCLAGWIAFNEAPKGAKLSFDSSAVVLPDGDRVWISRFATEAADLHERQADALFLDASDADELEAMIACLEANPDATYDEMNAARIASYTA